MGYMLAIQQSNKISRPQRGGPSIWTKVDIFGAVIFQSTSLPCLNFIVFQKIVRKYEILVIFFVSKFN